MEILEHAQAHCVDGDIKRVAGRIKEAVVSYLKAYSTEKQYTTIYLDVLEPNEKDEIIGILEYWLKKNQSSQLERKKYGGQSVSSGEIWNFIFALKPKSVETCYTQIGPLFCDGCYEQIIDCCSAILNHYPEETIHILLQRALAYTLLGKHEKEAISDYLQAFVKDKASTIQITRNKHGQHLPRIASLFRDFIYLPIFKKIRENKRTQKWIQLTADCCRFLLALDGRNFQLHMIYVERLSLLSKLEQAIVVLNEVIYGIQQESVPDIRELAECWLRMGHCYLLKNQTDLAVSHITRGLNAVSDKLTDLLRSNNNESSDYHIGEQQPVTYVDYTWSFLEDNHEIESVATLANAVLGSKPGELNRIYAILDKAASKLNSDGSYATVLKLENAKISSELYRAILVFKPKHRPTLSKLAFCYSRLGRHHHAIKIYDFLLSKKDYVHDSDILSARASCYREIGKKMEARKDYDILLRNSPTDAGLLFERSLVNMENEEIEAFVLDLQAACKSNQRTVSFSMKKLPLIQKSKLRQILFDRGKELLKNVVIPESAEPDSSSETAANAAHAITHLLTKLIPNDTGAHILKAHSLFFMRCPKDAEVSLKRLMHDCSESIDNQLIKWHLGLLKILSQRIHTGIQMMIAVFENKGEELFLSLLRDIPTVEKSYLLEESYRHGIDILHTKNELNNVQTAVHCFTIGINCCRVNDIIFNGLDENCKAYCRCCLARAECKAHLGDQQDAIRDFTAALEVNPTCVEGLCGRAFMLLALGDEQNCIEDITSGAVLDIFTVATHINILPDEAKKLMLIWIDNCVMSNLLQCGHKTSNLDYFHVHDAPSRLTNDSSPVQTSILPQKTDSSKYQIADKNYEISHHLDAAKSKSHEDSQDIVKNLSTQNAIQARNEENCSSVSTEFSDSGMFVYEDIIIGMERVESLQKAHLLGKLLIILDSTKAEWQAMFADILIVKGDFDEALLHLHTVLEITPLDVTAIARAGLINIKLNRYKPAIILLSMLTKLEEYSILYILSVLDFAKKRELSKEASDMADDLFADENYIKAADLYSFSLHSCKDQRIEKLRKRASCYSKIHDNDLAIEDMTTIINETEKTAKAGDYCCRAYNYLLVNKEQEACRDYKAAILIDKNEAYLQIHAKPGRNILSRVFYRRALEEFTLQQYLECIDTCGYGVFIDESQSDVKKLRARAKKKVESCVLQ